MPRTRSEAARQDTRTGKFVSEPVIIRFRRKVVFSKSGCWEWTSTSSRESNARRAQIRVDGKYEYAARVAYKLYRGRIPPNKLVLHKCDNPMCVNPYHLFLGTHRDNVLDAITKGRFKHMENIQIANRRKT